MADSHKKVLVSFRHVCIRFGEKVALRDVNLDIHEGETLGLIGASGSGKSVLVRSLIGLEHPQKGHIFYRGDDVIGKTEEMFIPVRKKIAYSFQSGALFDSFTVYDNLAYPLREHTSLAEDEIHKKVIQTLQDFGLEGAGPLFPANLSGGMQKRVGVARAVILKPELIIYDEPTTGLDPFNAKNICDLIIKLRSMGHTAIIITHDMKSAFYVADRIAMLYDGEIAYSGLTHEVQASDNRIVKAFITGEPV